MKTWKTTVTIPILDEKTAKAFMEMVWSIIPIAYIPKRAWWAVRSKGNQYTIYAIYREYPYRPPKQKPTIKIV